jgi:hypothetical protein
VRKVPLADDKIRQPVSIHIRKRRAVRF